MIIPIHEASKVQRERALSQMKLALGQKNEVPMYYCGGTLCIDIGPECSVTVVLSNAMNKEERVAAARLYIQHKTESHKYYGMAKQILGEDDKQTEEIKMLRSALERLDHHFRVYLSGKPTRNLDEAFEESRVALEKTSEYAD
jgi:hypothetical protein